jgi:hypothetical protein
MMIMKDIYERFAKKAPVSVMVRASIENVLAAERLDSIFDRHAEQQYAGELMFSAVADIMGAVVCQIHPSVNAAYLDRKEELGVTIKSVYDKLQGIEIGVSRTLVVETAERMRAIIKERWCEPRSMQFTARTRPRTSLPITWPTKWRVLSWACPLSSTVSFGTTNTPS